MSDTYCSSAEINCPATVQAPTINFLIQNKSFILRREKKKKVGGQSKSRRDLNIAMSGRKKYCGV